MESLDLEEGYEPQSGNAAKFFTNQQVRRSVQDIEYNGQVYTAIRYFCICSIAVGMLVELVVMYLVQHREYKDVIDNLLVLLIGGIPIAMPLVLSTTMVIGSRMLSRQGVSINRKSAIEKMAGMDVLCCDKTGTLTTNKFTVDQNLIEVFAKDFDKEHVLLFAARASRTENQDAIDAAVIKTLANPKEARAGIREVHFLQFNPMDKMTALTYIDSNGNWHRTSKGAPEQILTLCNCKEDLKKKVHSIIDKFAERGLLSLGVACQERKHICGMTGDGMNDAPALKKADNGIAVCNATDSARSASDIVLIEPGISVIISAVPTSRAIFHRMKYCTIYAVSSRIGIVFGFMLIALIWKFNISPFMVLVIGILNDVISLAISKDRVKPSPYPDSWKLTEIFATGIVIGGYLASVTVIFFWLIKDTDYFTDLFGVRSIRNNPEEMMTALYLQVSILSQALILVTRSHSWSFSECPGLSLLCSFLIVQLNTTVVAVNANWSFARIHGCGWGWASVIWLYSIIFYVPLDVMKFATNYALSGRTWKNMIGYGVLLINIFAKFATRYALSNKAWKIMTSIRTTFTSKREHEEPQWALAQSSYTDFNQQKPPTSSMRRAATENFLRDLYTSQETSRGREEYNFAAS